MKLKIAFKNDRDTAWLSWCGFKWTTPRGGSTMQPLKKGSIYSLSRIETLWFHLFRTSVWKICSTTHLDAWWIFSPSRGHLIHTELDFKKILLSCTLFNMMRLSAMDISNHFYLYFHSFTTLYDRGATAVENLPSSAPLSQAVFDVFPWVFEMKQAWTLRAKIHFPEHLRGIPVGFFVWCTWGWNNKILLGYLT